MRQALGIVAVVCSLSCVPPEEDGQGANGQNGEKGPQGPQGPAGPPAATDGSRLKVRYYMGEDGMKSVIPGEFWDSKRGEACRMLMDETGVMLRCMPASAMTVTQNKSLPYSPEFSDSACQLPVFYTDAFKYGIEEMRFQAQIGAEPRRYRVHLIGAKQTGGMYFLENGSMCRPSGSAAVHYKGTPIAPTEFAGVKIEPGQ